MTFHQLKKLWYVRKLLYHYVKRISREKDYRITNVFTLGNGKKVVGFGGIGQDINRLCILNASTDTPKWCPCDTTIFHERQNVSVTCIAEVTFNNDYYIICGFSNSLLGAWNPRTNILSHNRRHTPKRVDINVQDAPTHIAWPWVYVW